MARATAGSEESLSPELPAAPGLLQPEVVYSGCGAVLIVSGEIFINQFLPVLLADSTMDPQFGFDV